MARIWIFILAAFCSSVFCDEMISKRKPKIFIENRVLATVRGEAITVVDVAKKLDMIFYQQFAQYRGQNEVRYQFYQANWRKALDELIERKLAILLAEEKQITLSNGDVREELEALYGPNVLLALHEENISLDEAQQMLREDLLYRRVLAYFVQVPIYSAITPSVLKKAYEEKAVELSSQKGWVWRSITLKGKNGAITEKSADALYEKLSRREVKLRDLVQQKDDEVEISVSSQYRSHEKDISSSVASILKELPLATFSKPVSVSLKGGEGKGFRIYIVDDYIAPQVPQLFEMEGELRGEIALPEVLQKSQEFFTELRKQYHAKYTLLEKDLIALEPFVLKTSEGAPSHVALSKN